MCLGVSRLSRQLRTVAAHRFRRRLSPTAYVPEAAFCLTGDALYDEDDRWHRIVSLATQSPSVPIGGFNAAFKTHTIPLEFRQFNLSYARRELSPKTVHSRARLLFTQHVIHWKDRIALKWKTPEGLLEAIDDASVGTVPNVCRYIGRATGLLDRNHDERHLLFKEHIKKFDAHWLWTAFEYKAIEFLAYDMKYECNYIRFICVSDSFPIQPFCCVHQAVPYRFLFARVPSCWGYLSVIFDRGIIS